MVRFTMPGLRYAFLFNAYSVLSVLKQRFRQIHVGIFMLLLISTVSAHTVNAQGPCPNSNCVSGDIRVTEVMLVQKKDGLYKPMPTSCNTDNQVFNVSLKVKIDVTSQTRYGFLVIGDIYINGLPTKAIAQCNPANFTQGIHEIYVDSYVDGKDIEWKCGEKIELKNVYTAWNNAVTSRSNPSICSYLVTQTVTVDGVKKDVYTGALKEGACKSIAPKCKYYGPNESFLIVAPLAPSFSTATVCNNNNPYRTYTFNSTTTGGYLSPGGAYTYVWYINDEQQFSTTNTLIYTPTTGDDFVVRLTVADQTTPIAIQASTNDADYTITPISCCQTSTAPTTASKDINNTCPGTEVKLSVSGGNLGTNAAWKWYTGGCGGIGASYVSSGAEIKVSPAVTTTYYVRAEGDCGVTSCATVTVTVKTNSTAPTASVTGDNYCANSGSSATLSIATGTLGTDAAWKWYTNGCGIGDPIATGSSISVSPTVTTDYYVRAEGCNTTSCAKVTVRVKPVLGVPEATVTKQPTCNTNATVTVKDAVSTVTYTLKAGQTTLTAVDGVFSNVPSGTYSFSASKDGSCGTSGADVEVAEAPSAPATPKVVVTEHPSCSSSEGTLKVINSVTNAEYGTGYEFSNGGEWINKPEFKFKAGAGYNIKVRRVSPNEDCEVAISCAGEEKKGLVTPAVTSQAKAYDVEIKLDPKSKVFAAPNPFTERIRFTINSSVSGRGTLELYNLSGQKLKTVFEGQVQKGEQQTIEYVVPSTMRTSLIYVFTVGSERATGKLVGVKQ